MSQASSSSSSGSANNNNNNNSNEFLCDVAKPGGGLCKKIAKYFCITCNAVCEDCKVDKKKLHNPRHPLIEIASFLIDEPAINRADAEFKRDNEDNTLVELDYESLDLTGMKPGKKFFELAYGESVSEQNIQICSYVGPSGVGKSLLSRMLCDPKSDSPIPGDPQISVSTSFDIHAYNGLLKDLNFIIADCEGSGGTPLLPVANSVQDWDEERKDKYRKSKELCVKQFYPRLLYFFSDVVVYVFKGSRRDRVSILKPLIDYAASSTSYSVNNLFKPFVIAVYNMSTREEAENNWRIHAAQGDILKELKDYYREPQAIFIPDKGLHPLRWAYAVCELKNGIENLLQEAARIKTEKTLWLSKSDMFKQITEVTDRLSKKYDAEIDFIDFKLKDNPTNAHERVFNLFLLKYTEIKRTEKTQTAAFFNALDFTTKCIAYSFGKDIHESLLSESSKLISELIPCSGTKYFPSIHNMDEHLELVECEAVKNTHDRHSSVKTYTPIVDVSIFGERYGPVSPCQWDGPFEPIEGLSVESIKKYLKEKYEEYKNNEPSCLYTDLGSFLSKLQVQNICLSCIGDEYPTVVLACNHVICKTCCDRHTRKGSWPKSHSSESVSSSSSSPDISKLDLHSLTINCPLCSHHRLSEQSPKFTKKDIADEKEGKKILSEGHKNVVEFLLSKDPKSLDLPDQDEFTPLHIASQNNQVDAVKFLLDIGVSLKPVTKQGSTPLFLAAQHGSLESVITLLSRNAEFVDYTEREDRATPLYIASQNGHALVVKALLLKGANPHLTDKDGFTPIHIAAKKGHGKVLYQFYQRKVNLKNIKSEPTPLMLAAINKKDDVKALLRLFTD